MTKDEGLRRHKELVADGWKRRFNADEPRLSEMKEYYESLGLEVRAEYGIPDDAADCQRCFDAAGFSEKYLTIYTRGESQVGSESDEMYD